MSRSNFVNFRYDHPNVFIFSFKNFELSMDESTARRLRDMIDKTLTESIEVTRAGKLFEYGLADTCRLEPTDEFIEMLKENGVPEWSTRHWTRPDSDLWIDERSTSIPIPDLHEDCVLVKCDYMPNAPVWVPFKVAQRMHQARLERNSKES